ncbi:transferase [Methylocaldum marinum]|uniref:Transferase n=1 Tax=Methylocaldum marinum TaxID=1432792 RepID=A0A286P3Z4_9GAMM|nr:putative colanic acid biosynthesis acetyltransferase [Methylocaldum marinum]BBA32366.1 transferase [Methylocaldum marinum]
MNTKAQRLYVDDLGLRDKFRRLVWHFAYVLFVRPTPKFGFNRWRLFIYRLFGASIGTGCKIAPDCMVWAPWNLEMADYVALAAGVDCYNVAPIRLGSYSTVSQRAFLCTASHDIGTLARPLIYKPIGIEEHAWICAEAFIGPGVTVGPGAVVGARAVVMRDVAGWSVMAGNPARLISTRELKGGHEQAR